MDLTGFCFFCFVLFSKRVKLFLDFQLLCGYNYNVVYIKKD